MSPKVTAPGPPAPVPAAAGSVAAEALFKEAQRRQRRRRAAVLVTSLVLAAAAATGFSALRAAHRPGSGRPRTGLAGTAPGAVAVPGTSVAWVDYRGRLHLGDLTAGTQRVVATVKADPAWPLTQAAGRLYWVDTGQNIAPSQVVVRELDLANGQTQELGRGQFIFPATNGRHVFISRTDTRIIEAPADGSGAPRRLTLPPGWFVPYGESMGVGDGILVQSRDRPDGTLARTFGVWHPGSRRVRILGTDFFVIGAVRPPGARGSLLAWVPAACAPGQDCLIRITSTSTLSATTVRSPLHHGFAVGAAFSPDGRSLAVFVNRNGGPSPSSAQLALIDTRTGALRLVPGTHIEMGDPAAWARWLPDGRHLIAGGMTESYLIDATAMTAKPMFFIHSRDHDIETSQDLNYSAVIVPPRRPQPSGRPATPPGTRDSSR